MSEQTQADDFAAIAKPHPAAQSSAPASATPGDDFASIAKPHPGTADEQADPLAMPTLHDLSQKAPEQEHEGLYKMKDEHGNLYGVPYSNVEQVENFRNSFVDEKEAQRYEEDHRSAKPGLWARTRAKVLDVTEPTLNYQHGSKDLTGGMAAQAEMHQNVLKRVGRDLFGIVDMGPQAYQAFKKAVSDDPKVSAEGEQEIWNLHPGSQAVDRVREFKADYKKNPDLAFANSAGDALAFYAADKLAEGVRKAPGAIADKVGTTVRNRAGTGVHSTEKLVRDTAVKNEAVGPEAERIGKENDEVIAKAKTEAEKQHADKVEAVRKKNAEKAAEVQKKNDASSEGVRQANEKKTADHETAVDERNELVDKRIAAERRTAEMRTRLHNHLQDIHQSAERYFANQYDTLSDLTKGTRVDFSPLVEAVEDGKLEDIAGSDTKVPVFEDVLKRAKGEKGAGGAKPDNWGELAPDEQKLWAREHANDNGITYKDLVGYHRELGKLLKSSSTPVDIKDAIVRVRHVIEDMQTEAAKKADVEAAAKAAEQKKAKPPSAAQLNYAISEQYKNFAESYRDPGAEGTKAVKAGNAFEATKPYLNDKLSQEQLSEMKQRARGKDPLESGRKTNATKWAGRNSAADTVGKRLTTKQRRAQTEKLIDQARRAQEDLAALPDVGAPPTPPEPIPVPEPLPMPEPIPEPEFKPKTPALKAVPEEKKLSQRDLQLYKREQLNKKIDQLESTGMRIGVRGFGTITLAGLVTHLLGGSAEMTAGIAGASATAAFAGPKILARILKMPGMAEKLLTITKADVEALEKLPANQRVEAEQMIVNLAQAAKLNGTIKPSDPTPLAKWAKADMAKQAAAPAETEAVVEPAEPERGAVEVKLPVHEESRSGQGEKPVEATPKTPKKVVDGLKDLLGEDEITLVGPQSRGTAGPNSDYDVVLGSLDNGKESVYAPDGTDRVGMAKVHEKLEQMQEDGTVSGVKWDETKRGIEFTHNGKNVHVVPLQSTKIPEGTFDTSPKPTPAAPEPAPAPQPVAAPPPEPPAPAAPVEPPPPAAEPRSDHQPSRRLEDLKVDPKRFQYKLGGNKQGVTDSMSDAKWDQDLADPIHIWEDPENGEEYVVNGHHRVDLAQKAGAERIDVNKIDNKKWPTAADARRFGALKNIADGNGTSVDAAKFLREKGYTMDELRETGLSLKKAVAKEGIALSRLSNDLFDRVVDGKIDPKVGAAIGEASAVASDQEAILKDVKRRENSGRPVTPDQIRESARLVKASPTRTETTTDLFGDHEESRNLFLEMGEVSEYVQRELADEKRIFKRVASKGASDQLAKGKNVINPEENAKIATQATQAAQQRELYLKRSAQAGPIHAALQEAAERLAEGVNPNEVKQDAFDEIRQHLAEELGHPQ